MLEIVKYYPVSSSRKGGGNRLIPMKLLFRKVTPATDTRLPFPAHNPLLYHNVARRATTPDIPLCSVKQPLFQQPILPKDPREVSLFDLEIPFTITATLSLFSSLFFFFLLPHPLSPLPLPKRRVSRRGSIEYRSRSIRNAANETLLSKESTRGG